MNKAVVIFTEFCQEHFCYLLVLLRTFKLIKHLPTLWRSTENLSYAFSSQSRAQHSYPSQPTKSVLKLFRASFRVDRQFSTQLSRKVASFWYQSTALSLDLFCFYLFLFIYCSKKKSKKKNSCRKKVLVCERKNIKRKKKVQQFT